MHKSKIKGHIIKGWKASHIKHSDSIYIKYKTDKSKKKIIISIQGYISGKTNKEN